MKNELINDIVRIFSIVTLVAGFPVLKLALETGETPYIFLGVYVISIVLVLNLMLKIWVLKAPKGTVFLELVTEVSVTLLFMAYELYAITPIVAVVALVFAVVGIEAAILILIFKNIE